MQKVIKHLGSEIFYQVVGKGIPVLMVHGFGEDSSIWDGVKPDLDEYLLITPDLAGSGSSQMLTGERVSLADHAMYLVEILDSEKIEVVHLIGHSMGGYIAMEFASRFAHRLSSLTLFHSSAFADTAEKIAIRKKAVDFINTNGVPAFLKTSIPPLFKDATLYKQAIQVLIAKNKKFSSVSLVRYQTAMIDRPDLSGTLKRLKVPALFIIGEHDKAIPFQQSLKQCYLPPVSFVYIFRDSAHMAMLEERDRTNQVLNEFLAAALVS